MAKKNTSRGAELHGRAAAHGQKEHEQGDIFAYVQRSIRPKRTRAGGQKEHEQGCRAAREVSLDLIYITVPTKPVGGTTAVFF